MTNPDEVKALVERLRAGLSSGPNTVRTPWGKTIEEAADLLTRISSARDDALEEPHTIAMRVMTEHIDLCIARGNTNFTDDLIERIEKAIVADRALRSRPAPQEK